MKPELIAELIAQDFRRANLLQNMGIDIFSTGKKTLEDVCHSNSLDVNHLISELSDELKLKQVSFLPFDSWPLDFLSQYIVNRHHSYIRGSLPVILDLLEKITGGAHTENPSLPKLQDLFTRMARDMNLHITKEERILFPFIEQLVEASKEDIKIARPFFGTVTNPTEIMQIEHEHSWEDIGMIRSLTDNYKAENQVSESITILYKKLEEFEADLLIHLDLENKVLFPKAILLEKEIGIS